MPGPCEVQAYRYFYECSTIERMGRPRSFDTDEVLDRAVDLFWEHGFDATAMQALSRSTRLHSGSVYAAFGDKRGLFLQALQRYMRVVSQQAIEKLNANPSGLDAIRSHFASLIDAMVDGKRRWGCLVTNAVVEMALDDVDVANAARLHLARLEAAFAGAIERAKAQGELSTTAVSGDLAAFLVCTMQGLNVLAKTRPGRQALQVVVDVAVRALSAQAQAGRPHVPG